MKRLLIAVSSATLLASPLFAGAQAKNFEGFSAQIGAGFAQVTPTSSGGTITPYPATSYTTSADNLNTPLLFLGLAYDYALNDKWLLGVGASYAPTNSYTANQSVTISSAIPQLNATKTGRYWFNNAYSVYVKPSYVLDEQSNVYGKLGYTGLTSNGDSASIKLTGWMAAAGYTRNIDKNLYGFAEVAYAKYGDAALPTDYFAASIPNAVNNGTIAASAIEIKFGIGYKF